MHRLLTDRATLDEDAPLLPKEAVRHLKVLRVEPGERVELFDGAGASRVYAVRADRSLGAAAAVSWVARPQRELTLFACVTKGSRWDWTVEKATELGVRRIVPVISERTIVRLKPGERAAKRERWQRIAEDAARQSDALYLPEIVAAVDFDEALARARATTCYVGALTVPPAPPLASVPLAAGPISAFIGPEGDFTPDELSQLVAVGQPTSFGPTVLRAETAAIFAVSVLMARLAAEE